MPQPAEPMIGCVDVHYFDKSARAAIVVFQGWESDIVVEQLVVESANVEDYQPGEFYRRELPHLLRVLERCSHNLDIVIVDGFVWLDSDLKPGLGARFCDALDRRIPVVGVAKTRFRGAPAIEVTRGSSKQPLFVTAIGMSVDDAAAGVKRMHGEFRIPTQLYRVDRLARSSPQTQVDSSR
jgi:deoxyribonuclease V